MSLELCRAAGAQATRRHRARRPRDHRDPAEKRGAWKNLEKLEGILKPSPERRSLAKRLVACLSVILGIRSILWPKTPPPDGATVRQKLFAFLSRRRREAPQRGRGAYLRRFQERYEPLRGA